MERSDRDTPHERLAHARAEAGYSNATDAARAFGWNENTYRSHENGERGIKPSVASKYAAAFKISPAYILVGQTYEDTVLQTTISFTGTIGTGGEVLPREGYNSKFDDKYIIYMSAHFNSDPYAFEVIDDDVLGFLSKGDLVLVSKNACSLEEAIGRLCYVSVERLKGYITYVRLASTSGMIDLETSARRAEHAIVPRRLFFVQAVFFKGQWGRVPLKLWKLDDEDDEADNK